MNHDCVRCGAYINPPSYGRVAAGRACSDCLVQEREFIQALIGDGVGYDEYGVTLEWADIERLMQRTYSEDLRCWRIEVPMLAMVK